MSLHRSFPYAAIAGLALLFAAPGCADESSPDPSTPSVQAPAAEPETDEAELRLAVRALFEDRVSWTRIYLVETIEGLPGRDAAAARLLANGAQLGAAIEPFYGTEAATQLTTKLDDAVEHAATAVDAALAGQESAFQAATDQWYGSADEVASLLAQANPAWDAEALQGLLHACIDDALAEATALMQADYAAGITAFERHKESAQAIADALAGGIAAQFPEDVGPGEVTDHEEALRVAMRSLFFDRSTFVRMFLTDAIEELPSFDHSAARLMQNNADIGAAIEPFYGNEAAAELTELLDEGLADAAAAVTAAKAGDMTGYEAAKSSWLAHADETAEFLASANPNWPEEALQSMLRTCVEDVLAEAEAILAEDSAGAVDAHDALQAQARTVADALGSGVAAQFPAT